MAVTNAANLATACNAANNGKACTGNLTEIAKSTDFIVNDTSYISPAGATEDSGTTNTYSFIKGGGSQISHITNYSCVWNIDDYDGTGSHIHSQSGNQCTVHMGGYEGGFTLYCDYSDAYNSNGVYKEIQISVAPP